MLNRVIVAGISLAVLGGCAVTQPPSADGIAVERVVDAIQCELASVYQRDPAYADSVKDWLARVTLDLKVTNDTSFGGPTVTAIPILHSGALTVPFGPDLQDQSIRNADIAFDIHMRDLKPSSARAKARMPDCSAAYSGLPEAPGSLGIGDWISTVAYAAGRPDSAGLYEAGYDLQFTVVRGVHGGFTFKSVTVNADAASASAKRTTYNHLNLVFKSDPLPSKTKTGKTIASPSVSDQLDLQRQRFLPQRLILQGISGITLQ